jgi:hypothetical protein
MTDMLNIVFISGFEPLHVADWWFGPALGWRNMLYKFSFTNQIAFRKTMVAFSS